LLAWLWAYHSRRDSQRQYLRTMVMAPPPPPWDTLPPMVVREVGLRSSPGPSRRPIATETLSRRHIKHAQDMSHQTIPKQSLCRGEIMSSHALAVEPGSRTPAKSHFPAASSTSLSTLLPPLCRGGEVSQTLDCVGPPSAIGPPTRFLRHLCRGRQYRHWPAWPSCTPWKG
jgi:hypothetical protein